MLYTFYVYVLYMSKSVMIHFMMPYNDVKLLDKMADTLSETRSTLIRRAVHEFVDRSIYGDLGGPKE